MPFNRIKLGCAVTFMKYLASVVSLKFVPNTSVWNKIIFQIYFIYLNLFYLRAIKFTQSCIAGGK